ncbi:unnamed protein product [Ambrosiozyma monospora]|uniref:Unnamed protein product n=1 Tax=Ambrosiozyma monospora TaxID=43982 RepID=A0ACB5TCV8_AMBMO|nr:unnamed protein product [Ambrosiozyma monospora]
MRFTELEIIKFQVVENCIRFNAMTKRFFITTTYNKNKKFAPRTFFLNDNISKLLMNFIVVVKQFTVLYLGTTFSVNKTGILKEILYKDQHQLTFRTSNLKDLKRKGDWMGLGGIKYRSKFKPQAQGQFG